MNICVRMKYTVTPEGLLIFVRKNHIKIVLMLFFYDEKNDKERLRLSVALTLHLIHQLPFIIKDYPNSRSKGKGSYHDEMALETDIFHVRCVHFEGKVTVCACVFTLSPV